MAIAPKWNLKTRGVASWMTEIDTQRGRRFFDRSVFLGLSDSLAWWRAARLPGHYKPFAKRAYRYAPRADKYKKDKARAYARGKIESPDTDLVFTGTMRDIMLSNKQPIRRSRSKSSKAVRASVVLKGPRYLFQFRRGGVKGGPRTEGQMARELTTVIRYEEQIMENRAMDRMLREMQGNRVWRSKLV